MAGGGDFGSTPERDHQLFISLCSKIIALQSLRKFRWNKRASGHFQIHSDILMIIMSYQILSSINIKLLVNIFSYKKGSYKLNSQNRSQQANIYECRLAFRNVFPLEKLKICFHFPYFVHFQRFSDAIALHFLYEFLLKTKKKSLVHAIIVYEEKIKPANAYIMRPMLFIFPRTTPHPNEWRCRA